MSKLVEENEKIAEAVVGGYKKIGEGVVGGYKKIVTGVVEGFEKVTDKCVEKRFARVVSRWRRQKSACPPAVPTT